jgi:aspartyl-tRNA(Asn)/glutamyl-tRNA(Gln) amidotransferase subunit A
MLDGLGVAQIADGVRSGALSAEKVVEKALARVAARNTELNAFLYVARTESLEQARAIDKRRAAGQKLGSLAGVPLAIKDAICTAAMPTTAGSKILENYLPPYDATVIERLRAADAIVLGKTNMDEFAMGSSTENSAFGPAKNPLDPSRTPGGSSGGSAVAVAAGMAPGSLGSDTGGSIRQPAALTGTVGIKPTYGRVSRYGLIAFASSLDQIGPFASDVRGAARTLSVIAGHDPRDSTSHPLPSEDFEAACGRSVRGTRIGVPEEYFSTGLDGEVRDSVTAAIGVLQAAGCTVTRVRLPHTDFALATYYVLATAEASSNLARFDGIRYGLRVEPSGRAREADGRGREGGATGTSGASDLRALYGATRDAGFGAEVKRRILLGTFVLSAGYYDAYYLKAQKVRTLIRRDFDEAFKSVDVICSPTSPTTAFRLGEKVDDPLTMYLNDVYTLPASLAGIPAMSLPCRPAKSGLPVGLHVMARPFEESTMLAVAAAFEASGP